MNNDVTKSSTDLQKYHSELEKANQGLETAKAQKASLDVLAEYQKQRDEANLKILKASNELDKLKSWQVELKNYQITHQNLSLREEKLKITFLTPKY